MYILRLRYSEEADTQYSKIILLRLERCQGISIQKNTDFIIVCSKFAESILLQ